jgi:hypothetical protein
MWSADADGRGINVTTTVSEAHVPEPIAPLLALDGGDERTNSCVTCPFRCSSG